MTDEAPRAPIRLVIRLADAALGDRLAGLLAGIEGIELVGPESGSADVAITPADGTASGREPVDAPLTPRELEVLALLAEGASNKLIARRLGISAHTAKFHVSSVIDKLDAVSRTDAVAHAARIGAITL